MRVIYYGNGYAVKDDLEEDSEKFEVDEKLQENWFVDMIYDEDRKDFSVEDGRMYKKLVPYKDPNQLKLF